MVGWGGRGLSRGCWRWGGRKVECRREDIMCQIFCGV